jgi:YfiH family protein
LHKMPLMLEIATSDLLSGVQHGFFTRKGGASSGVFSGLNCGIGSSDLSASVALNRNRVAKSMDVAPEGLVTIHQVHSPDVVVLDGPVTGTRPKADAIVTRTPGLAIAVLTADCQPVLFAEPEAGVIGAAHAGWKGAFGGILENTVEAMVKLGATRDKIKAVIGPSISQRAYEVGPEFFEQFYHEDPSNARFFANGANDRYMFDLPGFGLSRLRQAGIADAEWTGHCTYGDAARFYSYRRSVHQGEVDYGRLISVIRL